MKTIFVKSFMVAILAALAFGHSSAQETAGELRGRVRDGKGVPVAGATISAVHQPSGTRFSTQSDAQGRYVLPSLRVGGPYALTVTFIGLKPFNQEIPTVSLGSATTLDVVLSDGTQQLGGIVVRSERAGPRANATGAGTNISREQLRTQPSVSRSLQDLTKLSPQSNKDNSFSGTNFRYNNITIDGAINNDAIGFSPSLGGVTGSSGQPGSSTRSNAISLDAIQDVQVYVAPYDVKLGNFSGGSINAVTRSGTNTPEGSLYAYGRNAAITGPDRVGGNGTLPSNFHEYTLGVRTGFPIIKNKLFFFGNAEKAERVDPVQNEAGGQVSGNILTASDADALRNYLLGPPANASDTLARRPFDPGTAGLYSIFARSEKYFSRLDWNIAGGYRLSIRNNTVLSKATNLERDDQNFRFSSIDFLQQASQSSTVLELRSRFSQTFNNNLIAGYTQIHDYRTPTSNPQFPQVQIEGRTPGTTIYLGTDREASLFDLKQKTWELTDNLTIYAGKHTLTLGTHNEFYTITYNFVNSPNGRIDYFSGVNGYNVGVDAFLNNEPTRARGSFNYFNNSRDYLLTHPSAQFRVNLWSAYVQDEIEVAPHVRLTPGLRIDYADVPTKQTLSERTQNALTDGALFTQYATFRHTPASRINNQYLAAPQASPRVGVNWDIRGDRSLVLRGGTGMFTSRIPFAWLGYAFYNNGDTFGSYDQRINTATPQPFTKRVSPIAAPPDGIKSFARANNQVVDNPLTGQTQVDLVDNDFKLPKQWRSSVALDYKGASGYSFTVEALYSKTIKDVFFQQINLRDQPSYYNYDSITRAQPIFSGNVDGSFSNIYLLSNTEKGYRYSITLQGAKTSQFGENNRLNASLAYTYGKSKDLFNGIRNSQESNWQLNQALNPNNPALAYSNFDIRHRLISSVSYVHSFKQARLSMSLFASAQSGTPFTYGFVNNSVNNTGQQVSLAYIPKRGETVRFFQDQNGADGSASSASAQAAQFDQFIDANSYLSSKRGSFTARNEGRTPWNYQADFRLIQEFFLGAALASSARHSLSFSLDVLNLTNLLNRNWGIQYFSPNTFNSTASVGLLPDLNSNNQPTKQGGGYPVYRFRDPGKSYSVDYFASRWQMQLGVRFTF